MSRFKCNGCGIQITPEWVDAIYNNRCPACGETIMDAETEELLTSLAAAMKQMKPDPICLAGWLVSNYYLKKVGSGEPTEFYMAKKAGNINLNGTPTQQQDRMSQFFKNAGVDLNAVNNIKRPDITPHEMTHENIATPDMSEEEAAFFNDEVEGDFSMNDIEDINNILSEDVSPVIKNHYSAIADKQRAAQQGITGGLKPNGFRRSG